MSGDQLRHLLGDQCAAFILQPETNQAGQKDHSARGGDIQCQDGAQKFQARRSPIGETEFVGKLFMHRPGGKSTTRLRMMMANNPAVEHFFIFNGFDLIGGGSKSNSATIVVPLKPWEARKQKTPQLAQEMSGKGCMLADGIAFAFDPTAIQGMGATDEFAVYVQGRTEVDPKGLSQVINDFMAAQAQALAIRYTKDVTAPTLAGAGAPWWSISSAR